MAARSFPISCCFEALSNTFATLPASGSFPISVAPCIWFPIMYFLMLIERDKARFYCFSLMFAFCPLSVPRLSRHPHRTRVPAFCSAQPHNRVKRTERSRISLTSIPFFANSRRAISGYFAVHRSRKARPAYSYGRLCYHVIHLHLQGSSECAFVETAKARTKEGRKPASTTPREKKGGTATI